MNFIRLQTCFISLLKIIIYKKKTLYFLHMQSYCKESIFINMDFFSFSCNIFMP